MPAEYSFYRLATIGWANALVRQTVPLIRGNVSDGLTLDLSNLEFTDSFGLTYLAACFHVVMAAGVNGYVRRPRRDEVHQYLLDAGFYQTIGFGERFGLRTPSLDRVDLVHITAVQPEFIGHLLDFLERMQPLEEGLRPSMRMALLELVQNFAEHSGSEPGAWISGQYHHRSNRITLCVMDLGRGIPAALRALPKYRQSRDPRLVELATDEGVSSVPGERRGLGLNTIRRFVRINGGTLTILSQRAHVKFPPDRRPARKRVDVPFPGTVVFMSLVPTRRGLFVL
ncbi:MAG: ATP-binding protein [Candidatus Binataceae bacterium]